MTAVSLGGTGKIASRAGMISAMTYETGESAWRLVSVLNGVNLAFSQPSGRVGAVVAKVPAQPESAGP